MEMLLITETPMIGLIGNTMNWIQMILMNMNNITK